MCSTRWNYKEIAGPRSAPPTFYGLHTFAR